MLRLKIMQSTWIQIALLGTDLRTRRLWVKDARDIFLVLLCEFHISWRFFFLFISIRVSSRPFLLPASLLAWLRLLRVPRFFARLLALLNVMRLRSHWRLCESDYCRCWCKNSGIDVSFLAKSIRGSETARSVTDREEMTWHRFPDWSDETDSCHSWKFASNWTSGFSRSPSDGFSRYFHVSHPSSEKSHRCPRSMNAKAIVSARK